MPVEPDTVRNGEYHCIMIDCERLLMSACLPRKRHPCRQLPGGLELPKKAVRQAEDHSRNSNSPELLANTVTMPKKHAQQGTPTLLSSNAATTKQPSREDPTSKWKKSHQQSARTTRFPVLLTLDLFPSVPYFSFGCFWYRCCLWFWYCFLLSFANNMGNCLCVV